MRIAVLRRFARIAGTLYENRGNFCESIRANQPDSRCESPGHLRQWPSKSGFVVWGLWDENFVISQSLGIKILGGEFWGMRSSDSSCVAMPP